MSKSFKRKNNHFESINKRNLFYFSKALILGTSVFSITANSAIFNPNSDELIFQTEPESSSIEDLNDFFSLQKPEISPNLKAKQLLIQGVEKLKKGEKQQGLHNLKDAWKLDPNLMTAGVMLSLAYIKNNDYQQALKIAKEMQRAKTQDDYGLGYTMEGMVYSAKGELDKANIAFKEAVRLIPNEKNALLNLAALALAKKNNKDATTYLNKILVIEPTHLKALEQLAKIEFQLGHTEKSTTLLKKAISAHPKASSPIINLTQNLVKTGKYLDVIKLTENKTNPAVMEMRGKANLYLGETEKARQIFEKIIELNPQSAPANFVLADFFAKTGNKSEASRQIQNTLKKDPKFIPARIGEIKILFYSGKVSKADNASQSLLKEFSNHPKVLGIAGWLSMQQKHFVIASKHFEQMAKSTPTTETILWWVNSLWAQNRHDEGFTILHDWLKDHQNDVAVHLAIADGYMGLQKKAEAKKAYLNLIKMQPKLASAYNNLAWLEQEQDIQQAIKYAEKALSLTKENPLILDTMGMLLIKDGKIEKGSALLKKAVSKAPNNNELLYHLAEALILQNKITEATPILDKLARLKLSSTMNDRIKALQAKINSK